MRLGELEGVVAENDGYTAESDAAILLDGLDIPESAARPENERIAGRPEGSRAARAGAFRRPGRAAARRAHQPPRSRIHPLAAGFHAALPGNADRDLARPPFPEQRLHAHRRYRLPDDHHVYRRLRRHGAGEDADPFAHRIAERAAREEDRAAQRIHRAVFGRDAFEPGDFAQEGSGAAADERSGEVEYRAAVYPLRDEAAVGPASAGNPRHFEILRRSDGDQGFHGERFTRREDRAPRAQRRGQDDAAALSDRERAGRGGRAICHRRRIGRMGPRSRGRILCAGPPRDDSARADRSRLAAAVSIPRPAPRNCAACSARCCSCARKA